MSMLLLDFGTVTVEIVGVVKYKPSALFRNLCDSRMSMHVLLLLSWVHALGLGLDRREGDTTSAHTRIAELPKIKRRLMLNDTQYCNL